MELSQEEIAAFKEQLKSNKIVVSEETYEILANLTESE